MMLKKMIFTIDEDNVDQVLDVLREAEEEGIIDFCFSVQVIDDSETD